MKVIFYPNRAIGHAINGIISRAGWQIVFNLKEADAYVWWKFTSEYEKFPDELIGKPCINSQCFSTLKGFVEQRFNNCYNETTFVDPLTYKGEAVIKRFENATHECEIIKCPIDKKRVDVVYQRFLGDGKVIINNRVPVIFGEVPYVISQYKNHKFKGAFHGGVDYTEVKKPTDVFTKEWLDNLRKFCDGYIDYAELDVVDNCIVDVNNTASMVTYFDLKEADYCLNECAKLLINGYKTKK